MNRFLLIILASIALTACVSDNIDHIGKPTQPSDKIHYYNGEVAPGRLMVRLTEGATTIDVEGIALDIEPLFQGRPTGSKLDRWVIVSFDSSLDVSKVAETIAHEECVEMVEFDIRMKSIRSEALPMPTQRPESTRSEALPFDDPELSWQWHYHNDGSLAEYADDENYCLAGADINLFNAWKYTAGDNRVVVAVMDGGIMADHPDLADNMWVNEAEKNGLTGIDDDNNGYVDDIYGYNFVDDTGEIVADSHGTHVAGTISAVNNNGHLVSGIAGGTGKGDGVRLMSIQIFKDKEGCYTHQIAQGFKYAADNGAALINNSWGYEPGGYASDNEFEEWNYVLWDAIEYFEENAGLEGVMEGGLAIFAAGNETYPEAAHPGAYHEYLCVAAMSSNFTASFFTNYGPGVNISAPGGDSGYGTIFCIASTSTGEYGYEFMQGTSMATPHVTGCAALALSYALKQGYTLTAKELRHHILAATHDINIYQTGSKPRFDYDAAEWVYIDLEPYQRNLGTGYIDAHKLLMQLDSTPCLYFKTGVEALLSLDEYFGGGSEALTYEGCEISGEVIETLGITTQPTIDGGKLRIKATKPGVGRITVSAIVGGDVVGGDTLGGMLIEREFELVVRGQVAENGAWL